MASYEPGGGAPKVVAKGAGHVAARIRQEAQAHDIPLVRDPIVTRLLYKLCDIDQHIPAPLYDAIAQVVAFVFFLDEKGTASGEHDSPVVHEPGTDLGEDLSDGDGVQPDDAVACGVVAESLWDCQLFLVKIRLIIHLLP